jgi:hypothetical protein
LGVIEKMTIGVLILSDVRVYREGLALKFANTDVGLRVVGM